MGNAALIVVSQGLRARLELEAGDAAAATRFAGVKVWLPMRIRR